MQQARSQDVKFGGAALFLGGQHYFWGAALFFGGAALFWGGQHCFSGGSCRHKLKTQTTQRLRHVVKCSGLGITLQKQVRMVSEKIFSIRYFKNLSDFGIFKLYLKPLQNFLWGGDCTPAHPVATCMWKGLVISIQHDISRCKQAIINMNTPKR